MLGACHNHAGNHVRVTGDVFRCGVDDDIDAKLDRALEHRGCPAVVDGCHHAMGAGMGGDLGQVHRLHHHGVGAFQIGKLCACHEIGIVFHFPDGVIADLNAKGAQHLLEKPEGVGVDMLDADDAVAGLEEGKESGGNGRHAGGEGNGRFARFPHRP